MCIRDRHKGFGVNAFGIVKSESGEQSEHGKSNKREQNGEEESERLDFHAACPDAYCVAGRQL